MCGIAGFYDPRLKPDQAREQLFGMLDSIAHRGPDARGTFIPVPLALGHNRLSIIDLSEDGNQPMQYFDAVIVYNGEIYNYKELRHDLELRGYKFKTKSDTEVILACYREYGERCVEFLVGMWAFAIWDLKEEFLFCSRDRFGIKPFYYIHDYDRFYFGSEYRALKPSPLFSGDLNWAQVSRGLQLGWNCYKDESYFNCIKTLPAACNLVFSNGRVSVKQYWDIDTTKKATGNFLEKSDRFRELMSDSIRLHMRSDVEVGGCLSGGLDSSAIASLVAKEFPGIPFKTFTIYYEGEGEVDERPWAEKVIRKYPQLEPHYLKPSADDIAASFDHAIDHAEVPIAGSSPISQYFVMRLARTHGIKVLLDGQGSDEYLGGYMHTFYRLIGGLMKSFRFAAAFSELNAHARTQEFGITKKTDVLMKSLLSSTMSENMLYTFEYLNYHPYLGPKQKIPFEFKHFNGNSLKKFLYHLMFTTSLPGLLHYEDRNSMAFSMESRVPFLDHRLVEYAFSLQNSDIIRRGETKRILRHSLRNILPKEIAERRDKKGFVTPGEVKWLRGPLNYLLEDNFQTLENLNMKKVRDLVRNFKKGDNRFASMVWRIAVLNYWMKKL
ncbi:MAG: asparagine synthase (glutamine-hydrolyzing) [Bacteroidetes bacterium]|nr:MAG: asparagine synthase (glutamine-hydrolyzing) [Bacteroidota bacterium]REK07669.1 MAG: asparagine synthase (glutamine-hydrolyzing) [Bacteroidota bacterium]REK33731.1 MAG: asparagine synthase (glutamine-hydrolyzing) [Bacteroidota bacterium]REK49201.1 MAG: asparagine synthase (glutamine-hydrolyzing) [Bacteroidota bacterium]